MKTYRAYDIKWETDGHKVKLPKEITFELDDDADPAYEGADVLSDKTGWLVNGFQFEEIADKE